MMKALKRIGNRPPLNVTGIPGFIPTNATASNSLSVRRKQEETQSILNRDISWGAMIRRWLR